MNLPNIYCRLFDYSDKNKEILTEVANLKSTEHESSWTSGLRVTFNCIKQENS